MTYPDFSLANQVALVTGAGEGIGYGLAKALAHAGASVAAAARSTAALDRLVSEIRAEGGQAQAFPLDVRDVSQIQSCVASVAATFGRLDILLSACGLR